MAADRSVVDPSAADPNGDLVADPNDDVAGLPYETARDELVHIVAQLEGGQVALEESMRLWQRGESLAAHCESWLARAEAAITVATTQHPSSPRQQTTDSADD